MATTLFKCWQMIYEAVLSELKKAGICDKFNRCTVATKDIADVLCCHFNDPAMSSYGIDVILRHFIIVNGNDVMPEWINVFPLSLSSIPIEIACSYLNSGQILPASLDNSLIIHPMYMNDLSDIKVIINKAEPDEIISVSLILIFHNQNDSEVELVINSNTRRAARFMETMDVQKAFTIFISMHRSLRPEHKLLLTIQKGDAVCDLSRT